MSVKLKQMRVKVKLFASFRDIIGKSVVELRINKENATLRDVLLTIFPDNARDKIFKDKSATELQDYVIVLKNRKHVNGLLTKIEDGDEISIFPQAFGG